MKTTIVFTSPEESQASILISMQSQIDQLRLALQPRQSTLFLTRHQAASLLNVSTRTIRTWTRKGKLTAYNFSRRVFFKRHELINVFTH